MKKAISLFLALVMAMSCMSLSAFATGTWGGEGTEQSPYLIANAKQLAAMRDAINGEKSADYANKYWKLTGNIDLNNQAWTPIGTGYYHSSTYKTNNNGTAGYKPGSTPFAGTFDGNGNTISNLSVATSDSSDSANGWAAGLFGLVTGTVQNLTINNATVSSATRFAGAVAGGVMSGGAINNCNVTGKAEISGRHFVGGVAGLTYGTITGCTVTAIGTITAADTRELSDESDRDGDDVGGIVGYNNKTATVTNNTVDSTGTLTVQGIRQAGAVVGKQDSDGQNVSGNKSNAKVVYTVATADQLKAALAEAKDGDTIKLAAGLALTDRLFVNAGANPAYDSSNKRYATTSDTRSITLDLNDHNITSTSNIALAGGSLNVTGTGTISTSASGLAPIEIRGTGDLANKRTLTIGEKVTLNGKCYGLNIFGSNDEQKNSIDVNVNGTINGMVFVIGNLYDSAAHNIVINVNDGATIDAITHNTTREEKVISGIAQNGFATVNVKSGASIKGETGIELRAGTLNVSGGTIEGTAQPTSAQLNNNGTTTMGAGIGVASYNNSAVTLNVTNGMIKGYTPLYFSNFNGSTKSLNLSVSGGSFTVTQEGKDSVANNSSHSETRATGFITGGSFSSKPDANYLASGKASALTNGMWVVGAAPTATEIAATLAGNVELQVTPTSGTAVVTAGETSEGFAPKIEEDGKISVLAKDMNAAINITVGDGTKTVTVAEYLKAVIDQDDGVTSSTTHKNALIAQATLNYGNAAAQYFESDNKGYTYTAEDNSALATAIANVTPEDISELPELSIDTLSVSGVDFVGASLVLKGATELRLNFRIPSGISGSFYVKKGESGPEDLAQLHQRGTSEYYYIVVDDSISPDDYGTLYNVRYVGNDPAIDMGSVCVNSYVKKLANAESTTFANRSNKTALIGKALYQYWNACKTN